MKPFVRVVVDEETLRMTVSEAVRGFPDLGGGQDSYEDMVKHYCKEEVWINDKYQVNVNREIKSSGCPDMIHLSIKLITEDSIHDWRELQAIKNMLVGEENEAVELYPAESRLVDMANRFHLWVFTTPGVKFPFGFPDRITASEAMGDEKQRPL